MAKKTNNQNVVYENNGLIDAITPTSLIFNNNKILFNERVSEVLIISRFPSTVGTAWLSRLTRISGVTLNVFVEPTHSGELIKSLDSDMKIISSKLAGSGMNPMSEERLRKEQEDILSLREVIEDNNEKVVYMSVLVFIRANDVESLNSLRIRVKNVASGSGLLLKPLTFRQQDALKSVSPYFQHVKEIVDINRQIMPMSTASASFPFNNSGINHGKGTMLGRDAGGGVLLVDFWKRSGDITNSNFVALGVPGQGKSATIKHILLQEYAQGTKIIILDPEREYKELCESDFVKGKWVNAGSGGQGRINPYQIRSLKLDEVDEDGEISSLYSAMDDEDGEGSIDVRIHLRQFLRGFHKLYFNGLSHDALKLLETIVIATYEKFGIFLNSDVSKIAPDKFPIFSDVFETAKEILKNDLTDYRKDLIDRILINMESGAIGADSDLWNGCSTINIDDDFVVIDTKDIGKSELSLKSAQYFNISTWIWNWMTENRDQRVLFLVDEAYLMADPEVPELMMFLRDVAKRIRKYNGGLGVITHSVVDFLDPRIKKDGQALLDLPAFKIFMGTEGTDLSELVKTMNLSDKEADIISSKQRGQAVISVGSKRVHAHITIEGWEFEAFGKSGGK